MINAHPRKNLYANPSVLYGPIEDGDWHAPIPGWGMNPQWAGPAMVGVGVVEVKKKPSPLPIIIAGAALVGLGAYFLTKKK